MGWVLLAPWMGRSSILFAGATPQVGEAELTFVYLHGFGGVKKDPAFCRNLREYLGEWDLSVEVVNYEWDSVRLNPLKAGASWLKAQRRADEEAVAFGLRLDELEREAAPYVLVGFSVGSRVVLQALERRDKPLEHLAGVYFLGSAMTKDTSLKQRSALPEGFTIINYHSPRRDEVHRSAFNFMSEIPAGGQVGFDDVTLFANFRVACSHAYKGVGIHIDYSGLAEAIAAIELYRHGVRLPGDTMFNVKTRVGDGDLWWNQVLTAYPTIGGEQVEVVFEQHNLRSGYFRALRVGADGKRIRIARATNLHAILTELGVEL